MCRMSSPGWYSRTSSKFMPWPLKTLWYCPASVSLTSRLVRNSIWRIFLRISRGIIENLRNWQLVEYFLNDRLAGLFLSLRLIGDGHTMTQDIHANAFDILRSDV